LQGIKIRFVAAGPAAAHCLAGDMEGKLYTWGRNEVNFLTLAVGRRGVSMRALHQHAALQRDMEGQTPLMELQ